MTTFSYPKSVCHLQTISENYSKPVQIDKVISERYFSIPFHLIRSSLYSIPSLKFSESEKRRISNHFTKWKQIVTKKNKDHITDPVLIPSEPTLLWLWENYLFNAVPSYVNDCIVNWCHDKRPCELMFSMPTARELLTMQRYGRRVAQPLYNNNN